MTVQTGKEYTSNLRESVKRSSSPSYLSFIGFLLVAFCLTVGGFFAGKYWGGGGDVGQKVVYSITGSKENAEVTTLNFDLFWDVWDTLKGGYVETDLPEQDMYYGAIKGMVDGIGDPVTLFLTPDETQQYNESNQGLFEGIGAELGYEDGVVVVVTPLEGSPAKEAGLRPGDRILAVDGVDVLGETVFEVVARIRGEEGTSVTITITHEGESNSEDVVVERKEISVPSISYEGTENGVAVVNVDRFTEASMTAWQTLWNDTIDEVLADEPDAMILDLRGNPGGYFNAAVWAAGEFLPDGTLVSQQKDRNDQMVDFTVNRDGSLLSIPLVVLVDGGSASASEILAGALKYHERAYIIGENTYGKGTAQQIIDYSDGSSLHITTVKWLLPDGTWLNPENVIVPDQEVVLSDDDFKEGKDPQLDAAQTYINSLID
jgi:carboxyl-terminal processing protease